MKKPCTCSQDISKLYAIYNLLKSGNRKVGTGKWQQKREIILIFFSKINLWCQELFL